MNKFKLSQLLSALLLAIAGSQVSAAVFTGGNNISTNESDINKYSIAIGDSSTRANNANSIAIGGSARTSGEDSIAIGGAATIGIYDAQYGGAPTTSVSSGVAVGREASIQSDLGLALGYKAKVELSASGGMALGANSVADRAGGATDAVSFNGETKSGLAWKSNAGAASIGSSEMSRQLTGVAAGSQDNDAVNVAQLRDLKSYTDGQLTSFQQAAKENTIFGEGTSNLISEAVPDDPDTTDINEAKDAVYAQNAVALGNNGTVKAHNGSAFGYNAQVMEDAPEGGVAIGAGSVASMAGRTATSPYVAGDTTVDTSKGGAWASEGLVSFGYTGEGEGATSVTRNRTLTGVAAGSEDNDAVNVAQLKQLEANTKSELSSLMTGETQVSKIQLTTDPTDENAPTIGLRYEVAKAEPAALADGDPVTPTTSQGRLVYDSLDAQGTVIGTETIATLNDGFFVKGGNTAADAAGVKVDLNKGISFLGDEYLQTTVTAGENGGAVVTVGASQTLKDFLNQSGVQPSDPTTPDNPGNSGNTGGSGWNPSQVQLAAMNGNFSNGITVAPGEGNQAIQIKQGNVDMGGNRIQNVGNPINDGDAANKAYVDSTSRSLRNKINDVDKDLRAGVAMAMAVGGLPQAYMPGKSIFGVSAGTYHGQGGFALGLSHATDNRQWVFKGAASVDTRGNVGGTLSAGYQF